MFTPPFAGQAMNFRNQNLPRAEYQGARGSGFYVEFIGSRATLKLEEHLADQHLAIRGASIEGVVRATDEIKQKIRRYLDSQFRGSEMHGNNHRRAANAASQSIYYNEIAEKGQFTGLIYSKLGRGSGAGFVDYLLLQLRGGTIKPRQGDWLKLVSSQLRRAGIALIGGQTGYFPFSKSTIFWARSADGKKLFLLRSYSKGSLSQNAGKTELLATLPAEIKVKPRLGGLDDIARLREPLFLKHFDAVLSRETGMA